MENKKHIWLVRFNRTDYGYKLALFQYRLDSKGRYLPKRFTCSKDLMKFETKWNLGILEEQINNCIGNLDSYGWEIGIGNAMCENLSIILKMYISLVGSDVNNVYIQRKETKNYASFHIDEIENCFMRLV